MRAAQARTGDSTTSTRAPITTSMTLFAARSQRAGTPESLFRSQRDLECSLRKPDGQLLGRSQVDDDATGAWDDGPRRCGRHRGVRGRTRQDTRRLDRRLSRPGRNETPAADPAPTCTAQCPLAASMTWVIANRPTATDAPIGTANCTRPRDSSDRGGSRPGVGGQGCPAGLPDPIQAPWSGRNQAGVAESGLQSPGPPFPVRDPIGRAALIHDPAVVMRRRSVAGTHAPRPGVHAELTSGQQPLLQKLTLHTASDRCAKPRAP